MLSTYANHNLFKESITTFNQTDPHLRALAKLKYQYSDNWWDQLSLHNPGIYILTGGRQVGKSTSCKLLIKHCLRHKLFNPQHMLYLPCDEIYDAGELSRVLRYFLTSLSSEPFLLVIDEITFVKNWDRVIKALADEGYFQQGLCLLTGSDMLILKEAAMCFPGRRGAADKTDFHLYPLTFSEYVNLLCKKKLPSTQSLYTYFQQYLLCGGYLRAINDLAATEKISQATFLTYEQWLRGDFLKQGKREEYLMVLLRTLFTVGVSPISYTGLAQKIGLISNDTCIDYMQLLERMDVIITLQAFDQNKKQGFPRKDRKFHFVDPFIQQTIYHFLQREGYVNHLSFENQAVEACVASHCARFGKTFYFKGQGEIDVICLKQKTCQAIEVKWANQLRANDLKMLKQFNHSIILGKTTQAGTVEGVKVMPVYEFLYQLS